MRSICFLALIAFSLLLNSCTGKLEVGNIDLVNWKNDRYGCNGLRIQQLDEIQKMKNDFLGANNQELIKTFGRPDRVILVDKSQSYFYYFLDPSEQCDNHDTETSPLKVMFRMNAINKVSEVNISRLDP
ncbi:hypothetical protein GCM10026987_05780 [Belliella aquatica]|uniref:Lipoprotein SmpA/OmlA domain-containing protein n=2 Tax=Belliella aquatica TaxID=1323734 RepID=A0ABQ1MZ95_9BACT|nr:hypothetical protein [Belliella aquatica]MCH7406666.1 hypothetical protein [Belliella aquatica]GGC47595.1 hypothetical protein GCM10010993_27680 [Belliella aquatica]